jgi:hypothetical protein
MGTPNSTSMVVGAIRSSWQTFQNSDGTTSKAIFTGGANAGSRIDTVTITSTDTAAQVMNVYSNDGTTDHPIGTVNIPAGAGTVANTPAVSLLTLANLSWLPASGSMWIQANEPIKLGMQSAVTASKTIHVRVEGGDY